MPGERSVVQIRPAMAHTPSDCCAAVASRLVLYLRADAGISTVVFILGDDYGL